MTADRRLAPDEIELAGQWILQGGRMVADETEARIHELIAHHLKEVGTAEQGWSKLFIDQETHTFWELTYPHAEMHGGGPKKLTRVTAEIAKQKYGV